MDEEPEGESVTTLDVGQENDFNTFIGQDDYRWTPVSTPSQGQSDRQESDDSVQKERDRRFNLVMNDPDARRRLERAQQLHSE